MNEKRNIRTLIVVLKGRFKTTVEITEFDTDDSSVDTLLENYKQNGFEILYSVIVNDRTDMIHSLKTDSGTIRCYADADYNYPGFFIELDNGYANDNPSVRTELNDGQFITRAWSHGTEDDCDIKVNIPVKRKD